MTDPRLEKLADIIVNYSLAIQKGEKFLIETTDVGDTIGKLLVQKTFEAGGIPLIITMYRSIQRAIIIAIQEIDPKLRQRLYQKVLTVNREHTQLIDYISSLAAPNYGIKPLRNRVLKPEPNTFTVTLKTGVGLVNGHVTRYRLSRSDYDYD